MRKRELTVGTLNNDLRLDLAQALLSLTLIRHLPQPARPPSRALTQQHHALPILPRIRDRKRVRLRPPGHAHPGRQHTQPDMLARAPSGIDPVDLDAREAERLARGAERGRAHARLGRAQERVAGPDEARGEDVAREFGYVHLHGDEGADDADLVRELEHVVRFLTEEGEREDEEAVHPGGRDEAPGEVWFLYALPECSLQSPLVCYRHYQLEQFSGSCRSRTVADRMDVDDKNDNAANKSVKVVNLPKLISTPSPPINRKPPTRS